MKSCFTLVGFLALSALAVPASADIIIDFEQGALTGGTITSAGVGTNIPVDILKVTIGTTVSFYDLYGAGPSSVGSTNGSALVNFNTGTGVFTVVGGVCVSGNTSCNGGAGTLVTSTTLVNSPSGTPVNILNFSSTTLDFREADTKAATLLAALGIAANTSFRLMDATFNYSGSTPFNVNSVDIQNIGVPEPTSILLLGSVMLGVTNLIRRRAKKA